MGRAAMEETKSILRRILYVTIFCFAIYGITSIGILVDCSRKKRSVSISTALILLAILLAFLVIFTIIICLWRRANQNIKSRRHGRDEEERWREDENGNRFIRTDSELRAIKRKEKYERRQKDRRRSIWDRIHRAGDRISARQVSYPWDARDGKGNSIRGPGPLDSDRPRKETFVPKQEPLFGHGGGNGLLGGRTALGAGLNPNHSRSPPASPRSPSRAPRTNVKATYPSKAHHRPAGSYYTEEEFEEYERKRHAERQGRQHGEGTQSGQVRKAHHVLQTAYVHREKGGAASYDAEGKEESGTQERREEEGGRQQKNGAGCEVQEVKMAVLNTSLPQGHQNTSPSRHTIPRKEAGTPPRRDLGALGAKLHDGQAGALMRESGVTIGYGGERVIMGPGRLPSKLVGHGLMAMPSQAHLRIVGRGHAGHESWRQASGFYANRTDGVLSMVSEEKSEECRDSEGSGKSWGEMTADEVQRERNKMKAEQKKKMKKKKEKEVYKAYSKGREAEKGRPLVVRNRTPTPPPPIRKDSPKRSMSERKESSTNIGKNQGATADLERSTSGVCWKTEQEQDILEKERWLHRASSFHSDTQRIPNQQSEGGKRLNTSPYQHLSALPDGLHISPKEPALRKTNISKTELKIGTLKCEWGKRDVVVVQETSSCIQPRADDVTTAYKSYTPATTTKLPNYEPPAVEEQRADETEWQRQKRIREWNEQNAAAKAHAKLMAALQPSPLLQTRRPSTTQKPQSFAEWEGKYKRNAMERGVSGFTEASMTSVGSMFPSYEDMEQERKEKAAEEERRKFSQFMAETGKLRSSEIERIADSALPMDAEELARIDAMVDAQLAHDKRATSAAMDDFDKETATIAKPVTALDSLPSQRNLAEARLAQENQEWARKNHEAASKLEIRSLHTTERGTTFSSVQTQPVATGGTPAKSGIPRLTGVASTTPTTKNIAIPASTASRSKPTRGAFRYNSGKKETVGTADTKKRAAKTQGQGSASKKVNVRGQ